MLGTTHGLSGLIIAGRAKTATGALLASAVSHFLLDAIPHFEEKRSHAFADASIGAPLILYFINKNENKKKAVAGAAGALLPDVFSLIQDNDSRLNRAKRVIHPTRKSKSWLIPQIMFWFFAIKYLKKTVSRS